MDAAERIATIINQPGLVKLLPPLVQNPRPKTRIFIKAMKLAILEPVAIQAVIGAGAPS